MSDILKIIDSFRSGCYCGRRHETAIRDIRIASGLVNQVGNILKENHFPNNLLLVADKNSLAMKNEINTQKEAVDWEDIYSFYGEMAEDVRKLNTPDNIIDEVDPEKLKACWPHIIKIIHSVPSYEECLRQ